MPKLKNAQKCPGGNTNPPDLGRYRMWPSFTSFLETSPAWNPDKMKYLIYGTEKCPTTGRQHFQGFVYFKDKVSMKNAQKLLNIGDSHIEHILKDPSGDHNSAIEYCKKGINIMEFGVKPAQGKRTDLLELRDQIMTGVATVDMITESDPVAYHQYGRTLTKLEDIYLRKKFRTEMTKGTWYWGATGVGKSHKAFENYDQSRMYLYRDDNGWWEGYTGQEIVIINDFRGAIPYNELLQIVDKWPYFVKRRGREPAPFISKHVIITSSLPPALVYPNRCERDNIEQLLRRFEVEELKA